MQLISRLRKLTRHQLAKDASWILLGGGFNFFIQAAYFLLLARVLGVTEYGIFAGSFALVNVVTPYAALGAGLLFMRYVTEDGESAAIYWGNALITLLVTTTIIGVVLVVVGPAITNIHSRLLIFYLVMANCLFGGITQVANRIFQTYRQMRMSAWMMMVTNVARLLILLLLWGAMHHANAVQWSFAIMVASGISAAVAFFAVRKIVPIISFRPRLILNQFWEGISFSLTTSSMAFYNDFDKTLLSHYGLNFANGFYTLAYRIIDFSATPIMSIDMATLPRYFQLNLKGLRPVLRLALKSIGTGILLSIGLAAMVWLVAPIVPRLVGHDYGGAVIALHWLCVIPAFRAIHKMSGSVLTATNRQVIRLVLQGFVAVVNLGTNVYLIPRYGWVAAAWTSVGSDGLLALLYSGALLWLWRTIPHRDEFSELTHA